jgi:hypothetical protein
LSFIADPVIYIPREIIIATENGSVEIRAAVYSSYINTAVEWLHEDNAILHTDDQYSISTEGANLFILRVLRIEPALTGIYEVVAITRDKIERDNVVVILEANLER